MTEPELKDFLDSFVDEPECNFVVVFSSRKTRRRHGSYNRSQQRIKIYERLLPQPIDLIAAGIHELAHHLAWERHRIELFNTFYDTNRFPSHGYVFKTVLSELLDIFNERYAERFQGFFILEKGHARYAPEFVDFVAWTEDTAIERQLMITLFTLIFGWQPKKSSAEHVSALTPIEAEGTAESLNTEKARPGRPDDLGNSHVDDQVFAESAAEYILNGATLISAPSRSKTLPPVQTLERYPSSAIAGANISHRRKTYVEVQVRSIFRHSDAVHFVMHLRDRGRNACSVVAFPGRN